MNNNQSDTPRTDELEQSLLPAASSMTLQNMDKVIYEHTTLLWKHARTLERELAEALKAGSFCELHKPSGGARNCLVCGCEKLTFALDKISYHLGEPNEHGLSEYGNHYNEDVVIEQAKALSKNRDAWKGMSGELVKRLKHEMGIDGLSGRPAYVATEEALNKYNSLLAGMEKERGK